MFKSNSPCDLSISGVPLVAIKVGVKFPAVSLETVTPVLVSRGDAEDHADAEDDFDVTPRTDVDAKGEAVEVILDMLVVPDFTLQTFVLAAADTMLDVTGKGKLISPPDCFVSAGSLLVELCEPSGKVITVERLICIELVLPSVDGATVRSAILECLPPASVGRLPLTFKLSLTVDLVGLGSLNTVGFKVLPSRPGTGW